MDKAVRGIRTYLMPELGGNVYVDPTTGKTCKLHRETSGDSGGPRSGGTWSAPGS